MPRILPRVPSGICGSKRIALANSCRMPTRSSCASRIDPQLWQTTLTAWPKVRTAVAAPQAGQLTDRTLTGGRPCGSAISPALEGADVPQPQCIEINRLADVECRRLV